MFAILEGACRLYDYLRPQIKDEYLGLTTLNPEPYVVHTTTKNFHSEKLNTNSYGFRGKEFSKIKPDNSYRIVILGGSAVYGLGASSDETTIPAFLEKELSAAPLIKGKSIEIINAGQGWYVSTQELILLITKILDLSPDMIVVFDGYNDFYHTVVTGLPPGYPAVWRHGGMEQAYRQYISMDFSLSDFRRPLAKLAYQSSFLYKLIVRTHTFSENMKIKKLSAVAADAPVFRPNQEIVDVYVRNLKLMSAMAKEYKIKMVAVMQPSLMHKNIFSKEEQKFAGADPYYKASGFADSFREMYADANGRLAKMGDGKNIFYFNILDLFKDNNQHIFGDLVHFTDLGSEAVAKELAKDIKNIIKR